MLFKKGKKKNPKSGFPITDTQVIVTLTTMNIIIRLLSASEMFQWSRDAH
jgi:glutaredoxin-related protein